MPLCDSQTLIVILIVVLIYALSPVDPIGEKTYGRRPVNDIFLVILLALGITALIENVSLPHTLKHRTSKLKSNCALAVGGRPT